MDLSTALEWAAGRAHGVLITIRADGRPQSSDIAYSVDEGTFLISITDDRAKTKNLRRDPRAVLHLSDPAAWSYVAFDGTVALTDVATEPHDAAADLLVAYYEQVRREPHPDWEEYRAAMVEQRRLLARLTPTSAVGQIN